MKKLLLLVAVSAVLVCAGSAIAGGPSSSPETKANVVHFTNRVDFQGGVFIDGGITIGGTVPQIPVVGHTLSDAGTPQLAVESRVITMSSNTATYTFNQAFSYAPVCTCGDTTVTTPVACSVNAATATQVVVFSIGASAVVNVVCVGAR